ncbi:MAG TPA: acetyl-CoA hydrolase/transferase C-terminal domain-containing protein [Anaerolineales bacterium]|nr:acetyl-CoA hydrolase/transferase C-terminal domain-containing protein [Anaerolineales bacterium]
MSWIESYRSRLTTAEEAVRVIRSGQRVFLTGNCSVPRLLLGALVARAPELTDVELVTVLTIGPAPHADPALQGHIRVNTLFISDNVRPAVQEGRADFTPCLLSEVPLLFRSGRLPLDVALIHVSPPDEHGFCSLGIEAGLIKTPAQIAKIVIAEINERMPRTLGDSFIHISKIDYAVPVDYPLVELPMGEANELSMRIGEHAAELIEDGSTMQMGIGAIPDAVLNYLGSKRDLGVHTELFSDGVMDLVQRGVITNERKTLHPGKIVAGFILGSQRLYSFVDDNPIVELHPTEYVNDPFVIAQNDRMVSINSAIEVDLTGQVCADSIGARLYSGVGGQMDFVYGASRSKGGKPIIALPSTAALRDGTRLSRIVPTLKPGAGVTTTRNHVHYVCTEFGVASLYGRTIRERSRALIEIAHPDFREELEKKATELKYL